MRKSTLLLLAILLTAGPALAEEGLEKAKKTYDFPNWPGKNGASKQGLRLEKMDLSPFVVLTARNRFTPDASERTLRYGIKTEKGLSRPLFEVSLKVLDTPKEAQLELLKFLACCTVTVPRGEELGLAAGDVSFAAKREDLFHTVLFARNNLVLRLALFPRALAPESGTPPELSRIAGKIDEAAKAWAEAPTPETLDKPVISEFTAKNATVEAGAELEIVLKYADPQGAKTTLHFDEGGGMVYQRDGRRVFRAEKPGAYTVTVYVANENFLVSRKSLTVTVTP
ncbi:MAG: hypothetical protein ACYS47_11900 [Planctomycetota bacterium]|jgi:hypothetical protein